MESRIGLHWELDLSRGCVTWSGELAGAHPTSERSREWWESRIHADDVASARAAIAELVAGTRTRWMGTYRAELAGGWHEVREQVVAVERDGRAVGLVGAIRDAVRPDAPLHDEGRFATFVDELPLLAWEADADGWIDFYNRRWFEYTGTTMEEMEGWGWVRVHVPDDLPRMLRVFRRAIEAGRPWEDEFRLRRADGAYRWHLSRAFPLRDATGRVIRWFGTNTDVHEQRLALEERERLLQIEQRLREEAQAASREKDEFVAVVSHELRTPLSTILTWSTLLQEDASPDCVATGLERITQNGRVLARLIEDLLDTSRTISGKLEIDRRPLDLTQPAEAAIAVLAEEAARREITVRLQAPPAGAAVIGDATRLQQVATNLVSNAIEFSFHGGEIDVRIERQGAHVVLSVVDRGEGISPSLLPHLFRRFRQGESSSRRRHGGLGLGLSIVRHLVELHGGTVSAASDGPGHGARFEVRLPAAELDGADLGPEGEGPVAPVSLAGIRVLAADDDRDTREVLALALARSHATVTVAGSAAEALARLRESAFDVVISGVAMPEVDGYALIDRLRRADAPELRAMPAIALTAHASTQDRDRALRAGFDGYVPKPYDPGVLSQVILELVRTRLMGQ